MRILVIGGTLFLGRHVVTAAAAAGHNVTLLHRGKTTCPLPNGVEELLGDRTVEVAATLGDREWDFVIDTSGQDPATVGLSVAHLAQRTSRYLFVSTVSVYADVSRPGITEEDGPLNQVPADGGHTPTAELYGALNAAAERVVLETFGDRGIVVRPGLIVGRWDPTDRFGYWAERVLEGGEVLAPGTPKRPVQLVDARDLAEWFLRLGEGGPGGTFLAVGPAGTLTMSQLLDDMVAAAAAFDAPPSTLTWVGGEALEQAGVNPWIELPLWLPEGGETGGFLRMDGRRAIAAGLTFRPLRETATDVIGWLREVPEDRERRAGLARESERALLTSAAAGTVTP
ncbi:NAD-dependent epimerase/dehydratase family protein [Rhodococcus marinonascens]|uniref:NAD-dependent epimerase/dehydratase family protein n=1 Tax=Rhodococcus marinonascens TaxID=38311 RepID=UPI000932A808|nr:NAD-dependent epimerase/dehydratase family protein [Rhodococcus marinonascens]